MYKKIKSLFIIAAGAILLMPACKKWEDHNRLSDEGLSVTLAERISRETDLSRFAELLVKSGYADIVTASKNFTVYAPTNAALSSLPSSIENDTAALKKFVGNHIAVQAYYTGSTTGTLRVPMINGKYHDITAATVKGVTISGKDILARNGVLQIINEMLPVSNNIWEFVTTDARMPSLEKVALADSLAAQFLGRVHNLRNESKKYTLFVLKDAAWQSEVNKLKPYYITGTSDSTANLAGWAVLKDLALDTFYSTPAAIPDTVLSKFNVKVGIDKSAIAATIHTSNGVVYVMDKLEVSLRNKFKDIIIEAENYNSASANRLANTYFRDRVDSATGKIFRDVLVYNHGVAQFNLRYRLTEIPSIKYRVYWMALHDNINGMTTTFTQKIGIDSFNSPAPAYVTVPLNRYAEQLAGEFTLTKYRPVFNLFLTAANSTTATANPLVCNYIRLEPVF